MAINDSNFLLWFAANESPTKPPIARPFVWEPDVLSPIVWLVPAETYHYYINVLPTATLPAGGFPIDVIDMRHENGTLMQDLYGATATALALPDGKHVYGQFIAPNLPEGFVRLEMGDYFTQWLYMAPADKAARFTAMVKFRSASRFQNFRYPYLPEDFYQQFRIRLGVKAETPQHDKEVYTESSTGKRRPYYSEPGWVVNFQCAEYGRWGHRAVAAMIEHDTILINGAPFSFESGYVSNMSEGEALSTGEFSLREENYSSLHRP